MAPPTNLEEAEILLRNIPLQPRDYRTLLNLSYTVPTANTLGEQEWRLKTSTLSPFKASSGTGNQNYAIQLDLGLTNTLQISGFYTEADDPLNAPITGLDIRPANFWEVYGAAARWKLSSTNNLALALNGSIESWKVGSGGSDSLSQNKGDAASPNIFNNSGQRVTTNNLVGSLAFPLTWQANKQWEFTFTPGINFLPSSQGRGQGGEGEFYGTNPYVSSGFLWHPTSQLGITASIAQPIGSGNNSFDKDLKYSKVPVFTGGINWHLNPRIALQGLLTNGFGATPATALLTFLLTIAWGTTQALSSPRCTVPNLLSLQQKSLSLGGLTKYSTCPSKRALCHPNKCG